MFVPPNDWPHKYIVTESQKVDKSKYEVTYTTLRGVSESHKVTFVEFEIAPGIVRYLCHSDFVSATAGHRLTDIYESGSVRVYQVSLTCFEVYDNSWKQPIRFRACDAWPYDVNGIYCLRGKVAVHLVNELCDDLLFICDVPSYSSTADTWQVFSDRVRNSETIYRITNLSAPATISVENNTLKVGVDGEESLDGDLPDFVSGFIR